MMRSWLAALGAAAIVASDPTTPQRPLFSSRIETVSVDVLVTEHGRPVAGLGVGDFTVFDEGVEQTVTLVADRRSNVDVVLALDVSDSVTGERLAYLRSGATALLDRLETGDRISLIGFNRRLFVLSGLTNDLSGARRLLERLEPGGWTSLVDAVHAGLVLASSGPAPGLLVVFSDGVDTASWLDPDGAIEAAKRSKAIVHVVQPSGRGRDKFLQRLSDTTGGALWSAKEWASLDAVFADVIAQFRQRYLLSYSPEGGSTPGWHRVEVRVKGRKLTVRARPGYFVAPGGPASDRDRSGRRESTG